jgi:hypothetical protein
LFIDGRTVILLDQVSKRGTAITKLPNPTAVVASVLGGDTQRTDRTRIVPSSEPRPARCFREV